MKLVDATGQLQGSEIPVQLPIFCLIFSGLDTPQVRGETEVNLL